MKKLMITIDTYSWMPYVSGTILQEEADFELLRLFGDQFNSIFWCRNLCTASIFEQRRFDFYKIGRAINAKKVSSLNYNESTFNSKHVETLITKLKVYTMFNVIQEIYIPDNLLFMNIFKKLSETSNAEIYVYGDSAKESTELKRVILTKEVYREKLELRKLMVGIHKKEDLDLYNPIERFY